MDQNDTHELGAFIRARRTELGLTLRDLERPAGLTASALVNIETGKTTSPTPRNLQGIARALDVDYEDLALLAGYAPTSGLPGLPVYLRTKYHDLTPDEIAQVDGYVEFLRNRHDDAPQEKGGRHGRLSA